MTLTQQVCSLEHAKRLKALNVKQESLFWWTDIKESTCRVITSEDACDGDQCFVPKKWKEDGRAISAFTTAELGEMIPKRIGTDDGKAYWPCYGWIIDIDLTAQAFVWWEAEDENNSHEYFAQRADTEADARAKTLIYLLEQKLIP